jgi:predicted secreted protein
MADIQLDARDANRRVEAAVGDSLTVALPESPSTGQSWFARTSHPAVLRPEGEAFDRSGPLMPGGTGTRRFRFVAAQTGETTLSFTLAFAATGSAADALSMEVTVH